VVEATLFDLPKVDEHSAELQIHLGLGVAAAAESVGGEAGALGGSVGAAVPVTRGASCVVALVVADALGGAGGEGLAGEQEVAGVEDPAAGAAAVVTFALGACSKGEPGIPGEGAAVVGVGYSFAEHWQVGACIWVLGVAWGLEGQPAGLAWVACPPGWKGAPDSGAACTSWSDELQGGRELGPENKEGVGLSLGGPQV